MTLAQGQFIVGKDFQYFQAASLATNSGLKGYRNQKFSEKMALVFGTDLPYSFKKFKTELLPLQLEIDGGVDYRRVWIEGEFRHRNNDFGEGYG